MCMWLVWMSTQQTTQQVITTLAAIQDIGINGSFEKWPTSLYPTYHANPLRAEGKRGHATAHTRDTLTD